MDIPARFIVCLSFLSIASAFSQNSNALAAGDDPSAAELFRRRILPLAESPESSSCADCHFGGVDLKMYVADSQEETFALLRDAGLINVDLPDESKILQFISRRPERDDTLRQKVRAAEFAAFQSWIRAAVRDPQLRHADAARPGASELPIEVIRQGRSDHVVAAFEDAIWSEIARCVNCHSPDRNRHAIGRDGRTKEDVDAISWIVPDDPEGTLKKLVDTGNIDLDSPEDSQVLTKPLGIVEHGGGPKFNPGGRTDRNFRGFLTHFTRIVGNRYRTADELPEPTPETARPTEQHFKITQLPSGLHNRLLRVDFFRVTGDTPESVRCATAEGPINGPQRVWQNIVFRTYSRIDPDVPAATAVDQLPAGNYVARIYIDRADRSRHDRDYVLTDEDFFTEVKIEGDWPPGYQPPKIIAVVPE